MHTQPVKITIISYVTIFKIISFQETNKQSPLTSNRNSNGFQVSRI